MKLFMSDETIAKFSKTEIVQTNVPIDILYEDSNILIINKPSDLEVIGSNSLTNLVISDTCSSLTNTSPFILIILVYYFSKFFTILILYFYKDIASKS